MRIGSRLLLALLLVGGSLFPACGGGRGADSRFALAPYVWALPFLAFGAVQSAELCMANYADKDADVWVTAFDPFGVPYGAGAVPEVIPAGGSLTRSLGAYTLGSTFGGWVQVETRDPLALDPIEGTPTPTETSGFVLVSMPRAVELGDGENTPGGTLRGGDFFVQILPGTTSIQIINASYVPAPAGATPEGVDFDVDYYDEDGEHAGSTSVFVPGLGTVQLPPITSRGLARVRPATGIGQSASPSTVEEFLAAGLEKRGQVLLDARFVESTSTLSRDLGFDLSFGTDGAGNVSDFAFVASNPTDSTQSVVFKNVWDSGGTLYTANRSVSLAPHQTKYLATSTALSYGLDPGEGSPFEPAFGHVAAFSGFRQIQAEVRRPAGVQITARDYDSVSDGHYRVLYGTALTNLYAAKMMLSPVLPSSIRNYASFMNPVDVTRTITIRGFTPGGTEYILPSVDVPPRGRVDWSPDGNLFREVPGDTQGSPVTSMSFLFTVNGGAYFGAREEKRAANDLFVFVRPQLVYNAGAE